jgi:hypothetical protein
MALDATLGGSVSDSYVTVAEADAYAGGTSWGADWLALAEADKEVALKSATRWMETIPYAGDRCDPSTDDANLPQALSWPRSGVTCNGVTATCAFIPVQVKQAEMELAWQLSQNPEAITGPAGGGSTAQTGTYVSKQQLGDLVQEFSAYPAGASTDDCTNCNDPKVISTFPWLADILSCWQDIPGSGGRVILRVRS